MMGESTEPNEKLPEPVERDIIEPLTEVEKLRLQVVMARCRAATMERENLVLQFLTNNVSARGLDAQVKSLINERNIMINNWCASRHIPPHEYAIDEETGKFVKISP